MGDELVSGSAPISYTEIFYKHLPAYIAYGMTADEFWNHDVLLAKAYREADKIKRDRLNTQLWLQGMYIYEVLVDVAPMYMTFSKNKEPKPYLKEPYPLDQEQKMDQEEREAKKAHDTMLEKMKAFATSFNAQFKQGD